MKNLLRLEELAQFLLCLGLLYSIHVPCWCYMLLLLGPDIGILGYFVNARIGAFTYNLLHHKALALIIGMGIPFIADILNNDAAWTDNFRSDLVNAGLILYGHASLDRIFGYGLKFGDSFHHTHLGWIGKNRGQEQAQGQ